MAKTPPDATDAIGGQADIDERKPPPSVASAAFNWFESDVEREEAVVELRLPVMPIANEAIGRITIFPRIEQTEDRQYTKNAQLECVAGEVVLGFEGRKRAHPAATTTSPNPTAPSSCSASSEASSTRKHDPPHEGA